MEQSIVHFWLFFSERKAVPTQVGLLESYPRAIFAMPTVFCRSHPIGRQEIRKKMRLEISLLLGVMQFSSVQEKSGSRYSYAKKDRNGLTCYREGCSSNDRCYSSQDTIPKQSLLEAIQVIESIVITHSTRRQQVELNRNEDRIGGTLRSCGVH